MKLFDKFLDSFSAKDLKGRVWGVVGLGFAIFAATAIGGFLFLTSIHTAGIEGTAVWRAPQTKSIEAAFSVKDVEKLSLGNPKYAIITGQGAMRFETPIEIISIDPANGKIVLDVGTDAKSPVTIIPGRFNLKLILYEEPYWKLLWGRSQESDEGN